MEMEIDDIKHKQIIIIIINKKNLLMEIVKYNCGWSGGLETKLLRYCQYSKLIISELFDESTEKQLKKFK